MEKFDVWITFDAGLPIKEVHDEMTLLDALQRLLHGPAALMGMIKEVKVVDTTDCVIWWAKEGKIVWPKMEIEDNEN